MYVGISTADGSTARERWDSPRALGEVRLCYIIGGISTWAVLLILDVRPTWVKISIRRNGG